MQRSETAMLLTFVHSVQGGEPTQLEVEAWHDLIGHIEFDDAMDTARAHFKREPRRLWPADLLKRRIASNDEFMYR